MSITASYRRLTPGEFQKFQDDPKAAAAFGLENIDTLEEDWDDSDYQADLEQQGRYLDIGRYWHALHFLLTGKTEMDSTTVPPPLGNVILGGTQTKWEATYGMVRSLTSEEVKEVAVTLAGTKVEDLRNHNLTLYGVEHLYGYHGACVWQQFWGEGFRSATGSLRASARLLR